MSGIFGSTWKGNRNIEGYRVTVCVTRELRREPYIASVLVLDAPAGTTGGVDFTYWINKPYTRWRGAPAVIGSVALDKSFAEGKSDPMPSPLTDMTEKTIRELQTSLPWTIRYSQDFRSNPQPHKDFTHALLHVGKASGKLMGLADDMDHSRAKADDPNLRKQYGKYLADLVVCALRASNTFPGGAVDLQKAVERRIKEKNAPLDTDPNPSA